MKNAYHTTNFILLVLLLSGCSQANRSIGIHDAAMHKQRLAEHYQAQQGLIEASKNRHRMQQVVYQKSPTTAQPLTFQNSPIRTPQINPSQTLSSQQHARELISKMAHSTIGAPYKWGGDNPKQGFDCSGLMSYVYKQSLGMNLPRTAAQQRDKSRTVSYEQLQPGDMLFFKTGRNANHVGVYIGNRKFVHAATGSKHVKIASMDSSYWHQRFVKFGSFL